MRKLVGLVILAAVIAIPSAASADGSHHYQPFTVTPVHQTLTVYCIHYTSTNGVVRVPVTETKNLEVIQAANPTPSTPSTVVGRVKVTGPTGKSLSFFDFYVNTPLGNPPEVQAVSGWALVGPGALAGDLEYLSPGTAHIDHYGNPFLITGHSFSVCPAIGAS